MPCRIANAIREEWWSDEGVGVNVSVGVAAAFQGWVSTDAGDSCEYWYE